MTKGATHKKRVVPEWVIASVNLKSETVAWALGGRFLACGA